MATYKPTGTMNPKSWLGVAISFVEAAHEEGWSFTEEDLAAEMESAKPDTSKSPQAAAQAALHFMTMLGIIERVTKSPKTKRAASVDPPMEA